MSIKLIIGCMFSGKTTELLQECNRWSSIGKLAICINYIDDDRYGNDEYVYSHNGARYKCIKARDLTDISIDIIRSADVILVNEGQFFEDIVQCTVIWCEKYNKNIVVSGLDGDYLRRPFGKLLDLIPYCNEVIKVHGFCAMCSDGTPAIFTKRITNENEQIIIGVDNYLPLCRKHYLGESEPRIYNGVSFDEPYKGTVGVSLDESFDESIYD